MFMSEAPLTHRIERLIDQTPIVDPHTHLRAGRPHAPDLAALMSYHWLQTELRAVGMPPQDFDETLPPHERVRRALPYLARMRNTTMSWCFHRILRDLYNLDSDRLDEGNYRTILDRVEQTGGDSDWPRRVLRERCNIRTVVTSLGNANPDPNDHILGVELYYMLDVHYLFCPGVATDLTPFFAGRTRKGDYYEALATVLGHRPATTEVLDRTLHDWLDRTVRGRARFSNTFIPIEQRFEPPDDGQVQCALARAAGGAELGETEIDALVQYVTWKVLEWHHLNRKAFQIAVGAEYFICDGKSIPRFDPRWTSEMARAFHTFSGARFDLMMASDPMMHDMCVLARQFPNVYLSGYWWHSFFPALIERAVSLRLQIAPMIKLGAFLCDAYYCEWTYGKLQVAKKAMAAALAQLVESRFLDEDHLPDLLRQVLHDTPRDLYELAD